MLADKRIVVLFGAGASFGAGHTVPSQPPLGPKLYDELANKFPATWGPASWLGRFADALRSDFEGTVSEKVLPWVPALSMLEWHWELARFFAMFAPDGSGADCYSRLLESLQSSGRLQKTAIASLNYECSLEIAAVRLGIRVAYFPEDFGGGKLPVLKVHGSCSFTTDDLSRWRYQLTNPGSNMECGIESVPPDDLPRTLESKFSSGRYPVLSFYSTEKRTPVAAGVIQQIRNAWAEVARRASTLAVIGVRFNAFDRHVIEPIQQSGATELLYVGGSGHFAEWSKLNSRFENLGDRFESALDVLVSRLVRG